MTLGVTMSAITVEGNGVTTAFAYPFPIPTAADLVVIYTDPTGIQTTLPSTQFAVSGIGATNGGTVTYPLAGAPIPVGSLLTIQRLVPLVQTTSVVSQGPTFGAIEDELDYEVMIDQQQQNQLDRTITLNVADLAPSTQLPPATMRAGNLMGFDAQGNPTIYGFPPPLESQVPSGWFVVPPSGFDDTANLQHGVNTLAALPGGVGGVLRLTDGATYTVSAAVNITTSNIKIIGYGVTINVTGAASYSAFKFDGTAGTTALTLAADAVNLQQFISVTALSAGAVLGNWVFFLKAAPDNGGAIANYGFFGQISSIGGTGPYTIVFAEPLPTSWLMADARLSIGAGPMIGNVGMGGDIRLVCGTTAQVNGITANSVVGSRFFGITGERFSNGSVLTMYGGSGNSLDNIYAKQSGSGGFADLAVWFQTGLRYNGLYSEFATGFGPEILGAAYAVGVNLISFGARGRGNKVSANLYCHYTNTQAHGAQDNGIALSNGTSYCTWMGASAHRNAVSEGFWFSDQFNEHNKIYGLSAFFNGVNDVSIGASDTDNEFWGLDCIVIGNQTPRAKFYGLNGALASGGTPTPGPVLTLTAAGQALVLPNLPGVGTERWIGGNGTGDIFVNAPTGHVLDLGVNNVTQLQVAAGAVTPGADITETLGTQALRWDTTYTRQLNMANGLTTVDFGGLPVSGSFGVSSIRFNNSPAVGQPKGWVCTVGGSPGTWVSMGNL